MWVTAWILIGAMSGSKAALPMPMFQTEEYCLQARQEIMQMDYKAKLKCVNVMVRDN